MLTPDDLTNVDEVTAWRVIAIARSIAPCLDSIPDGDLRKSAVAILQAAATDAKSRGSRHVAKQRIGPASVDYQTAGELFSPEDEVALRAMCGAAGSSFTPVGQFPAAGVVTKIWPEKSAT